MKGVFINFFILQVLFLALFAYIFGSLYQQAGHTHNAKILFIDYDQGIIGSSIRAAYQNLKADTFPTLVERSPEGITAPGDLREEVCKAHYWAALWVAPRATENLESAFAGGAAAASYNRNDVVTFIWNEARYSTSADSLVQVGGAFHAGSGSSKLTIYSGKSANTVQCRTRGILCSEWNGCSARA